MTPTEPNPPHPVPLRHRLLTVAWEAPCFGLALLTLLRVNAGGFGLPEFETLAGFLAFFVAFRLAIRPLAPEVRTVRYALAVAGAVAFAAALLYASAPVRARWFRSAVLEVRIRAVVDAPVPILVADQAGRITAVNRRAGRLLGYDRGELIGRDLGLLAPPGLLDRYRAGSGRAVAMLRARPAGWARRGGPPLPLRGKGGQVLRAHAYVFGARYDEQMDFFAILTPADPPEARARDPGGDDPALTPPTAPPHRGRPLTGDGPGG